MEVVTGRPNLPPRPAESNKGTFGHVLVVAGSRGMSGAAVLTGTAALRGGAGLVSVAAPSEVAGLVALGNPCYLTLPLPQDADGRLVATCDSVLLELARAGRVLAVGPGLGRSAALTDLVTTLLTEVPGPLVLDADGLNAIAGRAGVLRGNPGPRVLTPHPGEFARLLGTDVPTVQANRAERATQFAREHGVVLLLKGHGTIVTDGRRLSRNETGNPGMATGGSGDVLTGVIAALLAQGLTPFDAARLGAHVHGRAGDLARAEVGEVALIATDLLTHLPRAFIEIAEG